MTLLDGTGPISSALVANDARPMNDALRQDTGAARTAGPMLVPGPAVMALCRALSPVVPVIFVSATGSLASRSAGPAAHCIRMVLPEVSADCFALFALAWQNGSGLLIGLSRNPVVQIAACNWPGFLAIGHALGPPHRRVQPDRGGVGSPSAFASSSASSACRPTAS